MSTENLRDHLDTQRDKRGAHAGDPVPQRLIETAQTAHNLGLGAVAQMGGPAYVTIPGRASDNIRIPRTNGDGTPAMPVRQLDLWARQLPHNGKNFQIASDGGHGHKTGFEGFKARIASAITATPDEESVVLRVSAGLLENPDLAEELKQLIGEIAGQTREVVVLGGSHRIVVNDKNPLGEIEAC